MGIFGVPNEVSALQATEAQRVAAKAKSAERAASERSRRPEDAVEFKVASMEDSTVVRKPDEEPNDESSRRRRRSDEAKKRRPSPLSDPEGGLDLTA